MSASSTVAHSTYNLKPYKLTQKALVRLHQAGVHLTVWGDLLRRNYLLTTPVKDFAFMVPDNQLDIASEALISMGLPIAPHDESLLRSEGDFYRLGIRHVLTPETPDAVARCFHLVPDSFGGFRLGELTSITFVGTGVRVSVPMPSAIYSWMLRKMAFTYCRETPERFQLESSLEMYMIRHLHEFYFGGYPDWDYSDRCASVRLGSRMDKARKTLYKWKEGGEFREGEEWMVKELVGIILHTWSIEDIPAPDDG